MSKGDIVQGRIRKALVGAFVAGLCLSALVLGRSGGATAADPTVVSVTPEVVNARGFGHFRGDVRKIPPGQLKRQDKRPEPLEPSDTLPRVAVTDSAVQEEAAAAAGTTGA